MIILILSCFSLGIIISALCELAEALQWREHERYIREENERLRKVF